MVASIVSAGLMWLAVAQAAGPTGECRTRGPAPDDSAWFATVNREQPRAYFLKSQAEDNAQRRMIFARSVATLLLVTMCLPGDAPAA